jgi:hypothetical protein
MSGSQWIFVGILGVIVLAAAYLLALWVVIRVLTEDLKYPVGNQDDQLKTDSNTNHLIVL